MSLFILVVGLLGAILKYAEVDPIAKLSWWWISIPFIAVIIIWEVLTPLLGLDKKKEHEEFEKEKQKRLAKNRSGRPDVNM